MSTKPALTLQEELDKHPALYATYAERAAAMADEVDSWNTEGNAIAFMNAAEISAYGTAVRKLRKLAEHLKHRADTAARQAAVTQKETRP